MKWGMKNLARGDRRTHHENRNLAEKGNQGVTLPSGKIVARRKNSDRPKRKAETSKYELLQKHSDL
jgi:hypothetical protein